MPDAPVITPDRKAALIRGLQMFIFAVLFAVAETVLALMALFQRGWLLATGAPNAALTRFGRSLSIWIAAVAAFQTCASE
jgi:hypothetical protein